MIESIYRWFRLHTIKSRVIFWTSFLIILIGSAIFLFIYIFESRHSEVTAVRQLEQKVRLQEELIEQWLDERLADVQTIARSAASQGVELDQIHLWLSSTMEARPEFELLFYADADGQGRVSTMEGGVESIVDRPYFALAQEGKAGITGPFTGRQSAEPVLVFSAPIHTVTGEFQGIIAGSIRLDRIDALLSSSTYGKSSAHYYLVTRDGDIISRVKDVTELDALPNIAGRSYFQSAIARSGTEYSFMDYREVQVYGAWQWVADGQFLLIGTVDQAEVMKSVELIAQVMVIVLIFILLVVLSIMVWLSNHFERPLMEVLTAARAIRKGRLDMKIVNKRQQPLPDEFKELYDTFNGMTDTLTETISELVAAREQIGNIFSSLDISIWSREMRNLSVLQMSPGTERIVGESIEHYIRDPERWLRIIHPEDADEGRQMIERLRSGYVVNNQYRIVTPDGTVKWIQNHIKPILSGKGEVQRIDGITLDISERMLVEEELFHSQERFRTIFYRAGIGVAIIDLSGRFLETNPSMERILGYTNAEMKRMRCEELMHPDDHDARRQDRRSQGEGYQVERRFYHKDGSMIWARMTVTELYSGPGDREEYEVVMIEDITQHKRALDALEESENLYRSLVDLSPDAVMVHSDGVYIYVNEKAVQMLGGKRAEDILFKPVLDFVEPAYHEHSVNRIRELHKQGRPIINIDQRYVRLDHTVIDVELSASLVSYHHKQAILVLARDVTERKLNEEHIRHINQLLQRLSSTDGLTNIANRRAFDTAIEKEWRRASRQGTPLTLIMLDIDDFKPFNDTYGHQGGDHCLKEIATLLGESVKREGDLAARYGGEEFALLLPDTDEQGAMLLAENIRRKVDQLRIPHVSSEIADHVTVSMGVCCLIPEAIDSPQILIDRADRALYQAKRTGRNRVCLFEET